MRSRAARLLVPSLAVVLAVACSSTAAGPPTPPSDSSDSSESSDSSDSSRAPGSSEPARQADPRPGASGIGDRYWPLDGNGGIDVQHYDVHVAYDFDTGRLSGRTTLRVRATADLSRFGLDLLLPVSAVTVAGQPAVFSKPDQHELRITPATTLARGDVVDVTVTYGGDPSGIEYAGEDNWLVGAGEVVTINEPHMAPWWYPANDHPRDKATFDITVTGPATHQVVSNGLPAGRTVSGPGPGATATTHWRSQHPMTTYNAFFALGRYAVERSSRAGLPSYVAVSRALPADEQTRAIASLRGSGEVTAWLETRLGDYPFESTGGVVTSLSVSFALENQTRPVYPVAPERSLLVHELAHQWFGDSVSVAQWRDIWVNEGFATFMEVAYAERHGGQDAQRWLREARNDRVGTYGFWSVDLTDPGPAKVFDNAVYERGAMALQALRHRIGDPRFWKLLRTWTHDRRYANGSVATFRTLAERVSGQQLDGFFRAWLSSPRPPEATRANGLR